MRKMKDPQTGKDRLVKIDERGKPIEEKQPESSVHDEVVASQADEIVIEIPKEDTATKFKKNGVDALPPKNAPNSRHIGGGSITKSIGKQADLEHGWYSGLDASQGKGIFDNARRHSKKPKDRFKSA